MEILDNHPIFLVVALNKPFEVVVTEVKVVPVHFDKKVGKFVSKHKVVERRIFQGFWLMDDVVFYASEGLGKFGYRFFLRFDDGSKFPLLYVSQNLSVFEQEWRYGFDDRNDLEVKT